MSKFAYKYNVLKGLSPQGEACFDEFLETFGASTLSDDQKKYIKVDCLGLFEEQLNDKPSDVFTYKLYEQDAKSSCEDIIFTINKQELIIEPVYIAEIV